MDDDGALRLIRGRALARVPGLAHAATTRLGGVSAPPFEALNLGLGTEDDPAATAVNRSRVATALGFEALTTAYQVHGTTVVAVDVPTAARPRADALITDTPGVLVGVLGADCPGVLFVDEHTRTLAVAHAGWRGVAGGVIDAVLDAFEARTGTAGVSTAWIGPAIGIDRYEVSGDVADAICAALPRGVDVVAEGIIRPGRPGHARVSLADAIRCQIEARARPAIVHTVGRCTYDEPEAFFSYRRDGPRTGRHALVAGWLE